MSEPVVKHKPEPSPAHTPILTLPRNVTIEGAIDYPGQIVLAGTIEGDVTCASLTVTERGIVNGAVRSNTVTVLGEINGEIFANRFSSRLRVPSPAIFFTTSSFSKTAAILKANPGA